MIKILFICHGNICRSPMAEFIMKKLVHEAHLDSEFEIASAATSAEEIGNSVYPPARRKLSEHGISCAGKTARRVTVHDYGYYDLLIGMDRENMDDLLLLTGNDPKGKVHLLLQYTGSGRSVSDPWYTGDFEATWRDCLAGCTALLRQIKTETDVYKLLDKTGIESDSYYAPNGIETYDLGLVDDETPAIRNKGNEEV